MLIQFKLHRDTFETFAFSSVNMHFKCSSSSSRAHVDESEEEEEKNNIVTYTWVISISRLIKHALQFNLTSSQSYPLLLSAVT